MKKNERNFELRWGRFEVKVSNYPAWIILLILVLFAAVAMAVIFVS
ncbi:MAG: hypothetical protein KDC61_19895 [Saprospiraceae bacterium]|nr:hypothetical protein [Saprospiraceae bacterium]